MKIFQKNKPKIAQSTIEFSVVIVVICAGILLMGPYVIRGINAHMKGWEDAVYDSMSDPLMPVSDLPAIPTTGCGYNCPDGICCSGVENKDNCIKDCNTCGDGYPCWDDDCKNKDTPENCCEDGWDDLHGDGWCCAQEGWYEQSALTENKEKKGDEVQTDCNMLVTCDYDDICDPGETMDNCPEDCCICGNGTCDRTPCQEHVKGSAYYCRQDCTCKSVNCEQFKSPACAPLDPTMESNCRSMVDADTNDPCCCIYYGWNQSGYCGQYYCKPAFSPSSGGFSIPSQCYDADPANCTYACKNWTSSGVTSCACSKNDNRLNCGDLVCQSYENSRTCPSDCGSCDILGYRACTARSDCHWFGVMSEGPCYPENYCDSLSAPECGCPTYTNCICVPASSPDPFAPKCKFRR